MLIVLDSNRAANILLFVYLIMNIAYSKGLKSKPVIDITILAAGFIIRVFYGGFMTGVIVSKWLYLVVVTGSLYMGLGKRRNELFRYCECETRSVLKRYSKSFLDKNMYVCVALADVFYALWTLEMPNPFMIYTVPFFILILMRYSYDAEGNSDADPVEVIIQDKFLISLLVLYAICIFILIYVFGGNF